MRVSTGLLLAGLAGLPAGGLLAEEGPAVIHGRDGRRIGTVVPDAVGDGRTLRDAGGRAAVRIDRNPTIRSRAISCCAIAMAARGR